MSGSTFGKIFKITTFGESHGNSVGVVIDGCPAGIKICHDEIKKFLARRAPNSKFSTERHEPDEFEILSGVLNNVTLGTPICVLVKNKCFDSKKYDAIKNIFRPGHADYNYQKKFGIRDYRGGGRSSGRETVARVLAGYFAKKILSELKIKITAYTYAINKIFIKNIDCAPQENFLYMPDRIAFKKACKFLESCPEDDSVGGIVECKIKNLKAGVGEPVFDKLDAEISKAIISIGAVKAIEFGSGFKSAFLFGSQNNDEFYFDVKKKKVLKRTNNSGGITGGISDGSEIIFRVAIKPTPSISKLQNTVNDKNQNVKIKISGHHDKIIVPRIAVVIESMAAIVLVEQIFLSCCSQINNVKKNYFGW